MKSKYARRIATALIQISVALAIAALIRQHHSAVSATGEVDPDEYQQDAGRTASTHSTASPQRVGRRTIFKALLERIPQDVRIQFLESLGFSNGGLATARIDGIKPRLTPTEYQQLFQSFGVARMADHEGYQCIVGTATCETAMSRICIGENCKGPNGVMLGAILTNVPSRDRNRFLESLDFANGRLVSANISSVRSRLSRVEFDRLFQGLGASREELQKTTGDDFRRP